MSRFIKPDKSKVRATRYQMDMTLQVASKTLGTHVAYPLDLDNVSHSGMLLTWANHRYVPFIENTIIEMTVDPDRRWLKEPLICLGKVVRRLDHDTKLTYFGVHIVQMEGDDSTKWESCIVELSKKATVVYENLPNSTGGDQEAV